MKMTPISGRTIFKIFSNIKSHIFNRCYSSLLKTPIETNAKLSPYIILKANKDDHPSILKIMHETYYNEEPTCYSIGLHQNCIMDEISIQKLVEGVSLVVRCKYDGCIVGAVINESTNPWDPDLKEKLACNVQCPKMKHFLLFQAHVQRLQNLWDCLHVQKIFEITNMFVKPEARTTELLMRLMEESRSLAADCGHKVIRVNASTPKMAELCEKMKMKLVDQVPYCSYLGKNMVPIFNPIYPVQSLKVFIDENPQKSLVKK